MCSPTRASLLTGKHHARLHITTARGSRRPAPGSPADSPEDGERTSRSREVTLAEVFQSAGYLTAIVGKWHLGDAVHYPETQGFDINIGGTLWGAPATYFFPYRGEGDRKRVPLRPSLGGGKAGEYLTDRLTDEALKVIDSARREAVFPLPGPSRRAHPHRGQARSSSEHYERS